MRESSAHALATQRLKTTEQLLAACEERQTDSQQAVASLQKQLEQLNSALAAERAARAKAERSVAAEKERVASMAETVRQRESDMRQVNRLSEELQSECLAKIQAGVHWLFPSIISVND